MKLIYILFCALFLSNALFAQNLKPLNLSQVLADHKGDKSLKNILLFYSNDKELKRLNMTKSIQSDQFLEYAKGQFNVIYFDTRKYPEIAKHFEIHDCPIAIMTDKQGVELSRLNNLVYRDLGAEIDKHLIDGFTFPDREKKFMDNAAYGAKYAYFMLLSRMPDATRRILTEMFNQPIQKRFFITNGRKTLEKLIVTVDDPLFQLLISKNDEITKVLGKKDAQEFMQSITNNILSYSKQQARYKKNINIFTDALNALNGNEILTSDLTRFLVKNLDVFSSEDLDSFSNVFHKDFKKLSDFSKTEFLESLWTYIPRNFMSQHKEFFTNIFKELLVKNKNFDVQDILKQKIETLNK